MFYDNGIQLKNFGIQLQNLGTQIQNIGIQMNVINNIGNQLQNYGLEISNIGIQIFNIGTQISNMMINQNMPNMMGNFQNNMMPNNFNLIYQNMNQINEMESEISNDPKYNYVFLTQSGIKFNIILNGNKTVEELLKVFAAKSGFSNNDIEKENIYFLFDGYKIDKKSQKKIKDFLGTNNPEIKVYFAKNVTN